MKFPVAAKTFTTIFALALACQVVAAASLPAWVSVGLSNEFGGSRFNVALTPVTNDLVVVGVPDSVNGRVTRLDDAGNKLFSIQAIPSVINSTFCSGPAIDPQGNAVVGFTYTGSLALGNSNFPAYGCIVVKIDRGGNVLWGQSVVGGGAGSIKIDAAGNIYFNSHHTAVLTVGPAGSSYTAPANAYGSDAIIKLASNGSVLWGRDISAAGYAGHVSIESLTVNADAIFVTGQIDKGLDWGGTSVTVTTTAKGYLGRLNNGGTLNGFYLFGINTANSDCLLTGTNLLVMNGLNGFGTPTIFKFQTNCTFVSSVLPPFASGHFQPMTNNDFAYLGTGYAHYSNNLALIYSTTNQSLARGISLTNYFVYDLNPVGDLYVRGAYGSQFGNLSMGKIHQPEFVPQITVPPPSITNALTVFSSFNVGLTAIGAPLLSYQWQLNGTNLPGANNPSYTNNGVLLSDAGAYRCIITNNYASVTSSVYTVTVTSPLSIYSQPPGRLVLLNNAVLYGTNIFSEDVSGAVFYGKTISCAITNPATGWPSSGGFDFLMTSYNGFNGNYSVPAGGVFGALGYTFSTSFSGYGSLYLTLNRFPNSSTNSIIHFYENGLYFLETSLNPGVIQSWGNYTLRGGSSAVAFTAGVSGTGAPFQSIAYQWQLNGTNLPGATNGATLSLPSVTLADAGLYRLLITGYNTGQTLSVTTVSSNALLHVVSGNANPPPLNYTTVPANSSMNFSWLPGFVLQTATSLSPANWITIATNGPFTAYTTNGAGYFQIVPQ